MEKVNTKEQILDVALDLFSIRGYEATIISQIESVLFFYGRKAKQILTNER